MHKCSLCGYSSNKEFNVQRHINRVHNIDRTIHSCDECGKRFKTFGRFEIHKLKFCSKIKSEPVLQNVESVLQNVEPVLQNVEPPTNSFGCIRCGKTFLRSFNYNRHTLRCVTKQNPLRCPKCFRICASSSAKSHHMKHCEGHVDEDEERVRTNQVNITPSVVPAVPTQKARVINNTTINAHQINNITIVVFNPNGTEYDDNMDKKLLKSIFPPDNTQLLPQLCSYADALMSKQVNQNVRKSYMTSAYSDVKTEEGWKTLPDAHVYPYISRDIAISANDRLYEYPHIGNPDIRERLE